MAKIVRLTEQDLVRLVRKVIKEQEVGGYKEGPGDKQTSEFDYWNKLIVPQLTKEGFKLVDETKANSSWKKCPYACCKYMYFNNHSNGVNLFLDCGDGVSQPWKLKVYYQGNKGLKSFDVASNSQKASQDAIGYALQLKNKLYPNKSTGGALNQSQYGGGAATGSFGVSGDF